MNVGVALDEGQASPNEEFSVYYGERLSWCMFNLLKNIFIFLEINYINFNRALFNMCWKCR